MKPVKSGMMFLALTMSASAVAQPPQEGRRPDGGGQFGQPPQDGRRPEGGGPFGQPPGMRGRFPNPLMDALDKDKNGELSEEEIDGAVSALKSLDRNKDRKLDGLEIRPQMEGMGRGGFGGGFGGPGGPEGRGPGGQGGGGGDAMVERMMAMDADKDGKLSKAEIPERLQPTLERGDKNQDGFLDREEIQAIARERSGQQGPGGQGPRPGDFINQMMERTDANKDGKLTGEEVPPFLREQMATMDTNKDESLDKAELEAGMAARIREGQPLPGGRGAPGGRGEGRGEGERARPQRPPVEEEEMDEEEMDEEEMDEEDDDRDSETEEGEKEEGK